MLFVSVSDQVRFKNKRGHVISTLLVTIEFDKFICSGCDKGAKNTNSGDRKKQGGKDTDQVRQFRNRQWIGKRCQEFRSPPPELCKGTKWIAQRRIWQVINTTDVEYIVVE